MSPRSENSSRVVVVTGASAGVGRAVARRFAEAGDRVGLIARDAAALDALCLELKDAGAERAVAEVADVAEAEAVFAAAIRLEAALGPIDVWVNNAMETVFSPLAAMTPDEFQRVTEVTYLGNVHGTMAALKAMRKRGRGRIVQVGSALAYRGIPLQSAYCGAKHAIRGFTESVRTELLHERSKITIAMIDLPAVNTPQFDWARTHMQRRPRPMGRPIQPEAAAEAIFRVASGRWREYWLGVPTAEAIFGDMAAPGLLDRFLARRAVAGQQTDRPVGPAREDNLEKPVNWLHRTRGSFSNEAKGGAVMVPAPLARLGVAAAGAVIFMAMGAAALQALELLVQSRPALAPRVRLGRPAP